ncbi:unnamed protein product [Ceutorhynchus assimilis]|uniref:Fibrinogen C-terminal domain-containing protein n=1 Tax=Ceutorhynchus assimilis TaxID=467358 RepID=A0A9N9MTG2_9CUCU|nr:unnamed protein product [Ceutorhynchus assimilis]
MGCAWLMCFVVFMVNFCKIETLELNHQNVGQENLASEISSMKTTMKVLSDQWEKWNTLFITSLEPRITSTASTLTSIDTNIHNLQERAHVWDTFQLHVAAWNDQLASMDRKIDILNKGIEQLTVLDNKMNTMLSEQYKQDKLIKMTNSLLDTVINIETSIKSNQCCKSAQNTLFEEFAARGILSSLKLVERKVDQLLSSRQSDKSKLAVNEDTIAKYAISKSTENLINDISSKVDIIFDSISKTIENDYTDEYIDAEGSGSNHLPKSHKPTCKSISDKITNIDTKIADLIVASRTSKNAVNSEDLLVMLNQFAKAVSVNQTRNMNILLDSYFHKDKVYWSSTLNTLSQKCFLKKSTSTVEDSTITTPTESSSGTESVRATNDYRQQYTTVINKIDNPPLKTINGTSCSDMDNDGPSGLYLIKPSYLQLFCESRNNIFWTVIQRRDNYSTQQNFNESWNNYKYGFGDLRHDFWIGNRFLSRLSNSNNLTLRIEMEDFDGNNVWAEYSTFKIANENQHFQLTIAGYSGNASDSFSSHSGAYFSTYDVKNDYAPDCCPCSVSYGGGWWFNRCFESNLNGVYYKKPHENDYFRGIIWEHWLGNYSLKKSLMMVRTSGSSQVSSTKVTRFEDP